jgi:benzylsuccinate CoA-transferase BbsF subunit
LTVWPDRPPAGPYGAYTDYVSPRFTVAAVLAALDHKRRTGEGVYIDQSQGEASLHFLAPAILDYTSNGRVGERAGNRDRELAPNGVYPAAGGSGSRSRCEATVAEPLRRDGAPTSPQTHALRRAGVSSRARS